MKVNVADLAMSKVDLEKPETMQGIGLSLVSIAPLFLDAIDLFEKVDRAKERGQSITPTAVRLSIARLRSTIRQWVPEEVPAHE